MDDLKPEPEMTPSSDRHFVITVISSERSAGVLNGGANQFDDIERGWRSPSTLAQKGAMRNKIERIDESEE